MAFCENCGAEVKDGEKKCPFCGKKINTGEIYTVDPDDVVQISEKDADEDVSGKPGIAEKLMAAASYWGWLIVIPMLLGRGNSFVKFHLNQGINIMGVFLILYMLARIISFSGVFFFILFIFTIIGTINSFKGTEREIPLIGRFRLFK